MAFSKRKKWGISLAIVAIVMVGAAIGLTYCSAFNKTEHNSDALNSEQKRSEAAQETAISFYKAVWIDANVAKAKQHIVADKHTYVEEDMAAVPQVQLSPGPVVLGMTPDQYVKEVYLYRPDIAKAFKMTLRWDDQKQKWLVTDYQLDANPKYERVRNERKEMEWSEIQNP